MYKSFFACTECDFKLEEPRGLCCPNCGNTNRNMQGRLYCYVKTVKVISKPNHDKKWWQFWKEDFIKEYEDIK